MLSPNDEKQWAIKVSQLYGRPLNSRPTKVPNVGVGNAVTCSIVLSIPMIAFAMLFNVYKNSAYNYVADIQGASIIFILGLFAVVLFAIPLTRYAKMRLDNSYVFGSSLFWITLLIVIGYCFLVFQPITGSAPQAFLEIFIRISLFALSVIVVSVLSMIMLVKTLHKILIN